MRLLAALLTTIVLFGQTTPPTVANLVQVKRIYVAQLSGGPASDALRELIIVGIDSTKRFVLTDNADRADAVLKGAADDHTFEDTFDASSSLNAHENSGKYGSGSTYSRGGGYTGMSVGESESRHTKERKHEAYASVRLCNRDGDVLWSTTQESLGAKFRGAGADVAAKVARQLSLDFDRVKRESKPATNPSESQPALPPRE